ncbi:hypothetical protein D3C72_2148410 [compost metagenome]
MLERGGSGEADTEMLGRKSDGRHELQRVIDRNLRRLVNGMVVRALVDVVIADDVGDEDAVEDAALQRAGKILPVVEVLVFRGLVARMRPKAGRRADSFAWPLLYRRCRQKQDAHAFRAA